MKTRLAQLVEAAIVSVGGSLSDHFNISQLVIERARDAQHGHFACNIAMVLAKKAGMPPREIAQNLTQAMQDHMPDYLQAIDIAGPGFINFTLTPAAVAQIIPDMLTNPEAIGQLDLGKGQRVYLEYVSANPTGPLHVGHGRGAAFGASLANVLTATGYDVQRAYYVNDAGRQMQILALSVWLRYLQVQGVKVDLPSNAYQGDYVIDIAKVLRIATSGLIHADACAQFQQQPEHTQDDFNRETHIDQLINTMRDLIGADAFAKIQSFANDAIVDDIREDLAEFGVEFDAWVPESALVDSGALSAALDTLKAAGHTYEQDGALWFRSSELGDDKDRVLMRANGLHTYFAADIANHFQHYQMGLDRYIDIFGADHHGYVARVRAALEALGCDVERYAVLLVQFAILYRGKEKVAMSTRSGKFVSLRDLRDEVGNDAARFFYVMRKPEQHMDFDLELAKAQSNDNPVYYVQYACARVSSVFRQLEAAGRSFDQAQGLAHLDLLTLDQEQVLLTSLSQFSECLESASNQYAPHLIAHFLQQAAGAFHTYYNAVKFIVGDEHMCQARLCLITAIRLMLASGLSLLGVSAPEQM